MDTTTPRTTDQKYCFSCGEPIHLSADRCPKCGAVQPTPSGIVAAAQPPVGAVPPAQSTGQQAPQPLPPNHVYCRGCGAPVHATAAACPKCGAQLKSSLSNFADSVNSQLSGGRSKIAAALLAFFLGGFGAHKFYLGRMVQGFFYLLFCWTFIPAVIAFIEGILYLSMSERDFNQQYN